jgi:hypothetical protein
MLWSTCGGVMSDALADGRTLNVMLVPTTADPLCDVAPPR